MFIMIIYLRSLISRILIFHIKSYIFRVSMIGHLIVWRKFSFYNRNQKCQLRSEGVSTTLVPTVEYFEISLSKCSFLFEIFQWNIQILNRLTFSTTEFQWKNSQKKEIFDSLISKCSSDGSNKPFPRIFDIKLCRISRRRRETRSPCA